MKSETLTSTYNNGCLWENRQKDKADRRTERLAEMFFTGRLVAPGYVPGCTVDMTSFLFTTTNGRKKTKTKKEVEGR